MSCLGRRAAGPSAERLSCRLLAWIQDLASLQVTFIFLLDSVSISGVGEMLA
jgi:hypothetical protein